MGISYITLQPGDLGTAITCTTKEDKAVVEILCCSGRHSIEGHLYFYGLYTDVMIIAAII